MSIFQTKHPKRKKKPGASECANADLERVSGGKEYSSLDAKTTVTSELHSVTRDLARLNSVGVWIGRENRSQEQEPNTGDQIAELWQVSGTREL